MSHRDSPRLGTIWTCLRTALLSAPLAGSTLWTQTQDKAAISGGYYTITPSFSHTLAHSGLSSLLFFHPILARALFLHLRYSIDPQSDPEALFRIASDTGFISTVMELDREQEQWHNITVIATQRGMSAVLPSGAMSIRPYQSHISKSSTWSWENKMWSENDRNSIINLELVSISFSFRQSKSCVKGCGCHRDTRPE